MTYLEKIKSLPEAISSFFLSDEQRHALTMSCYAYGLDDDFIIKIAPSIGSLYIGELYLKSLPSIINSKTGASANISYGTAYEINKRIFNRFPEYFTDSNALLKEWETKKSDPTLTEDAAWQKVLEIEPWIAEEEAEKRKQARTHQEEKEKIQASLERVTLENALEKYPEISEQIVTSERIFLKNLPETVRPSVKNWLSDYTFVMGFDPHDSAARGIYLFQNQNTRKLNQEDRWRLSFILKAYDTNEPITVNSASKQILFPRPEPTKKMNLAPNPTMPQKTAPEQKNSLPPTKEEEKPFHREKNLFQKAHQMEHLSEFPKRKAPKFLPSPLAKSPLSGTFTIQKTSPFETDKPKPEKKVTPSILPSAQKSMGIATKPKVEFSSPQKLPFEKQAEQKNNPPIKSAATPVNSDMPRATERPKDNSPQPLKIIPSNRKINSTENGLASKNIVNLKEQ